MSMGGERLSIEQAAKRYVNHYIYHRAEGLVMTGPFKGMKMFEEVAWEDGNVGTKILGCYEQELHTFIENEVSRLHKLDRPANILDLGCSEGYYAIGMGLRLPGANIVAMDTSEQALYITQEAAKINEVTVHTAKECPYDFKPDLVICDCEGAEMEYLDPEKFPGLKEASLLVECHDIGEGEVTKVMADRFEATHKIYVVDEGARDPNQFEILRMMDSTMRWLAISEGRPCTMHWLLMGVLEK